MMLSKPPKCKAKPIPPPKTKRIKKEFDEDNKENIFQKNIKFNPQNRHFGKDITNSITNLLDRNHSGFLTKRNSFVHKENSKVHIFIKKNPSATQLGSKTTKEAIILRPQITKKTNFSLEKKTSLPTQACHSYNNSIKAKSSRLGVPSLRNSVSIVESLNFHKSLGKNNSKKEISINTLSVSQNKEINMLKTHGISNKELEITKPDCINEINSIKKENNTKIISLNKENVHLASNSNDNIVNESLRKQPIKELIPTLSPEQITNKIKIEDSFEKQYFDTSKNLNIQVPSEYINSIYHNLLLEEKKSISTVPEYNYMKNQKEVNEQMRSILVDWLIDVHLKFLFTDETLYMTVLIIDRYLSVQEISRSKLQLLGITALMIACKHEEIDLPKVDDFIYITDNAYTRSEVFKMENEVLHKLNFELLFPSPIKFFELLANGFEFNRKQLMMGKYLMESFLIDIKSIKYKSSIIACACAYIVMKFFKMKNYYESYNKKYYILDEDLPSTNIDEFSVKECAKDICLFVDNIHKTNFASTHKKFSKVKYEKVALLILGK